MLKQRIITAAVGVPLVILAVWFGNPGFAILIAVVAVAGTFEFYHVVSSSGKGHPLTYFGLLWALALILSPLSLHYRNVDVLPIVMTFALMFSLIWLLCRSPREEAFHNWAWTVAGVLYVGWMLSYWLNLRILEDGASWVYLALFTTFASDTGSFFVGRAWGKRKLVPVISPGKTWEGALGGLLSAVVAAVAISRIPILFSHTLLECWWVILLGCLISLFAQLGDLVESLFKRNMGMKEAGKVLPGHGGVLDRFDSLIFTGVVVYYYVVFAL